jgi:hypothetical protein
MLFKRHAPYLNFKIFLKLRKLFSKAMGTDARVDSLLEYLNVNPFAAYYNESMSGLAIILPPSADKPMATAASLTIAKLGWPSNLAENIF